MEVVHVLPQSLSQSHGSAECAAPSIEPHASGHAFMEQIEFTKKFLDAGFAYESEGSVYFDVEKVQQRI